MKFNLHPWELRVSAINLEGEVDFELRRGDELCQFRRVQSQSSSCPYFRFLGSPEEHFMLANFHVSDPRLRWEPLGYINEKFSETIEQSFQSAFEQHTWGRYFWLRPDLSCIQNETERADSVWNIFLLANGQGTMVGFRSASSNGSKGMSWNSVVPFQWHRGPAPDILRARTNSQWIEWLQNEMEKPESSVRFAHDLAGLSGEEAKLRFTVCKRGNLQEWEKVIHWILQSESAHLKPDYVNAAIKWVWPLVEKKETETIKRGTLSPFGTYGQNHQSDPNYLRTVQRLQMASHYFVPSLDIELIERHLYIEYPQFPVYIAVSTPAPSAHEGLEAALNLREWAQGKFSAEELDILCGF